MGFDVSEVKFATQLARVSIRTLVAFFVFAFCLAMAERYLSGENLAQKYALIARAEAVAGQIALADEKLTNAATAFAISSNDAWKRSYDEQLPVIDGAIAEVRKLVSPAVALKFDEETRFANDKLVALETEAFRLAGSKDNYSALRLLRGVEYDQLKKTLAHGADDMLNSLRAETAASAAQAKWLSWVLMGLLFAVGAAVLAVIWRRLNAALKKSEIAFLTSEQQIRDELAATHATLNKQNAMSQLGQLTATVAHELRNPLGAVRTSAFLLERKFAAANPAMSGPMERIKSGITRCDEIITQLLDFSRSTKAQTTETVFDEWLENTLVDQADSLPPALTINCALSLNDLKVGIDRERLRRVVVNLVTNASEAMLPKGIVEADSTKPSAELKIESKKTERGIEVKFTDNGPGIAPDVLHRIFEPLFTTKSFGTGLGLPAVQNILQQHDGGLDVRSELGRGTTFTLWLPIEKPVKPEKIAA